MMSNILSTRSATPQDDSVVNHSFRASQPRLMRVWQFFVEHVIAVLHVGGIAALFKIAIAG